MDILKIYEEVTLQSINDPLLDIWVDFHFFAVINNVVKDVLKDTFVGTISRISFQEKNCWIRVCIY